MKRISLIILAVAAIIAGSVSCQKYDDSQIRQEIKDLGERIAALEAWTRNSQEAVDYVTVLKEAVKNMNSIESVDVFEDEHGSGYVITFTNKQTIKLYNGKDGDTFFGKVNVGTSCVEFILADGTSFIVDRVTSSISFDSFETKTIARGSTIWTVMNEAFTKSEFAAFTAELKTDDGTATSIATKSAVNGNPWKIEAIAPEFGEDGKLVKPAGVIFKETPQAGSKGVLKVTLITNDGKESVASIVVEVAPNYLSFRAVEAGATVSMEVTGHNDAPSLEYSTDLNEWTKFDFDNPQTITLKNVGDKVYWRNTDKTDHFTTEAPAPNAGSIHFKLGSKKVAAEGNVMSLLDKSCEMMVIPSGCCFKSLFYGSTSLTKAPELPATELADACYYGMFNGCTSLEEAPELPAEKAASRCYKSMFYENNSLKKAPDLPATEMADSCYAMMFYHCTSLAEAPELPAKKLAGSCYIAMFYECASLETAPELPATELASGCYEMMFWDCPSLEKAPELPATELSKGCYNAMFAYCTSLVEAPGLPATELADECYSYTFYGCTSLETAPKLPATKLTDSCYYMMFANCLSLKYATELPATTLTDCCYYGMFNACPCLETAPELPATELAEDCYCAMFEGCTSLETAPELRATKLKTECYCVMFEGCTSLQTAPELPATELADWCCYMMFSGCTSLETAPELPAATVTDYCYYGMFNECSSLKSAPALPATTLADWCYCGMFFSCSKIEKAPELPAETLAPNCYSMMFANCINVNHIKVGFTDWGDGSATANWVANVAAEGTFECPEGLKVKYGNNYIPKGWSVVSGGSTIVPEAYANKAVPKHRISPRVEIRASLKAPKLIEPELRIHK